MVSLFDDVLQEDAARPVLDVTQHGCLYSASIAIFMLQVLHNGIDGLEMLEFAEAQTADV